MVGRQSQPDGSVGLLSSDAFQQHLRQTTPALFCEGQLGTSDFDAVDRSSTRHVSAKDVGAVKAPTIRRSYPFKRSTIGLDIAKSVIQVHSVDAGGHVVLRRQLKRRYVLAFFQKLPPCLVGIEACASGPSVLPIRSTVIPDSTSRAICPAVQSAR
jgi:hypothetical protein